MQIQILKSKKRQAQKKHQQRTSRTGIHLISAVLVIALLSVAGCEFGLTEAIYRPYGVNERAKELKDITLPASVLDSSIYQSKKYNFMIITDMHYGSGRQVPERQILNWLDQFNASAETQAKKPLFCIILGDMAHTGNKEDFAAFNTFQEKLEVKGIPVYSIVGNHDLLNSGWQYWKTSCNPGTSFFRFKTDNVSWYFTDTGSGTMGETQLSALEQAFAADSNRKLLFSHYPIYGGGNGVPLFSMGNEKERARIIDLYANNNVKYSFEGHWHPGGEHDFGSFKEYIATSLQMGKWYLVSVDETKPAGENPIAKVEEINLYSN
ncbi:MAG: metallophosphoesterase [Treponemataceae bacterium]|nr:metallophosphoesterase [Treponemataceae bacterium]